jgi:thiol-disulfide isomerase/thioredoxin
MFPFSTLARGMSAPVTGRFTCAIVLLTAITAACRPRGSPGPGGAESLSHGPTSRAEPAEAQDMKIVHTLYPLNTYSQLIGRSAPPLDIAHWLSAGAADCKPFKTFESGRVYVIFFWASWCPRCQEALPRLLELTSIFPEGLVTVLGVSHEAPEDVRQFLAAPDTHDVAATRAATRCCLAADPDESVHHDYMEAVDDTAIPTVFVVGREGLIEWIGHPVDLEGPLTAIIAGRWDREAFVVERHKIEGVRARMATIVEDACGPRAQAAVAAFKAFVAERWDDAADLNEMSWLVYEFGKGKPLPADLSSTAVAAVARSLDVAPDDTNTLDTLAHLQAMQGQYDEAIATQTRAVDKGGASASRMAEYLEELRSQASQQ